MEFYWNGSHWQGRRDRLAPAMHQPPQPRPGRSPAWFYDRWLPFWNRLDASRRAIIIIGAIVAVAVVFSVIAMQPWESRFQDECEAAALENGYNPSLDEFDAVVGSCVHYGETFGHL